MRKYIVCGICVALLAVLSPNSALATIISYDLESFTGDPIEMSLTIDDDFIGGLIRFDLAVDTSSTGNTGDLRGFFFNLDPFPSSPPLTEIHFSGDSDMTQKLISNDLIYSAGNGSTIVPAGAFDVGIEFGTPGIGTDDIQSSTFYLNDLGGTITLDSLTSETDDMGFLFGARFTSVGPDGSDRTGSSKISLVGAGPSTPVPEPATLILFSSGMIGLSGLIRKRRS